MLVDVHAHYTPRAYADAMFRMAEATRPAGWAKLPHTDDAAEVETRLRYMDDAGVQMQVLSHGIMAPYAPAEGDAVEVARLTNDLYAELTRRYPDRFAAFVSLPLPHVDASLKEMERALDQLGMVGVAANCSVLQRSLAEPEFEPLYEEMNRRGAALYFHPCASGICSPWITDWGLTGAAGALLEDTVIVLHMITRQIPVRYPRIKIIVSHCGGLIPMALGRLDHQMPPGDRTERASDTARRLYYDTVSHGVDAALHCAVKVFGADHMVPGSDWPVLLADEPYRETFDYIRRAGLPEADVDQILERTAPAILNLQPK